MTAYKKGGVNDPETSKNKITAKYAKKFATNPFAKKMKENNEGRERHRAVKDITGALSRAKNK